MLSFHNLILASKFTVCSTRSHHHHNIPTMSDTTDRCAATSYSSTMALMKSRSNSLSTRTKTVKDMQTSDAKANMRSDEQPPEVSLSAESRVKEEKQNEERDLKDRVENSVRRRIGKKALIERGDLYWRVFTEEIEIELGRAHGVEDRKQGESLGFGGETAAGRE